MLYDQWTVALYDFRSKQEYIYKTNAIQEIIGASNLLSEAYDMFLNALEKNGIKIRKNYIFRDGAYLNEVSAPLFNWEKDDVCGEVLYVGGGNLYMLYQSRELFIRANQIFSRLLLDKASGLTPVCACVNYTGDYGEDWQRIYAENSRIKNTEPISENLARLPFTQLDRKTSLPVTIKTIEFEKELSLSRESDLKRQMGKKVQKGWGDDLNTFVLDTMTEKGIDSLLAVIYIDGNGMSDRIRNLFKDDSSTDYTAEGMLSNDYQTFVKKMRAFSNQIHQNFVEKPIQAIQSRFAQENLRYRRIIGGGDEITIICRAKYARLLVAAYFNELIDPLAPYSDKTPEKNTACAGIAIFHSHDPYSKVYQMAEQCCESAKKQNREDGGGNCIIDFHFCHSGITNRLEVLRRRQEEPYTCRPYCYSQTNPSGATQISDFVRVGEALASLGRAQAKGLCERIMESTAAFEAELTRLKTFKDYRHLEIYPSDIGLAYDAGLVMDLWFLKEA